MLPESFASLLTTENAIALFWLATLEIVLGIDNIVFIAILTGRLPTDKRPMARRLGLVMAMLTRILLLFSITWVMKLVQPLFAVMGREISGKDLILLGGGLFLLAKATFEIHHKIEGQEEEHPATQTPLGSQAMGMVVVQIMILDIVFSLDSVITAVGMAKELAVMIIAVMLAVGVMLVFANTISDFIENHPTVKMLALSFLILVGVMLVAEGAGQHIEKGYLYFAMAFSLGVEMLNIRAGLRRKAKPKTELA